MNKTGVFHKDKDYHAGTWGAGNCGQAGELRNQYKDSGCVIENCCKSFDQSVMQTDFLLLCGEWIVEERILLQHP